MGWLGKEGDYVDYTLLKKKGLLKVKEQQIESMKTDGGFVDFTSMVNNSSPSPPTSETSTNNFGFLADMAGVGTSNPQNSGVSSPLTNASSSIDEGEFRTLKVKIDDMEYKLDRFIERIDKLEEKLARFG